jgi:NADPH:quinone reductase-like Zn-dependent oxidoreductase
MKRIWITRKGGPEVLELREEPDPECKPGEVRIRVKAAGVNFADVMARMGLYPDAPKLPAVVGYEVAGVTDDGRRVIALTAFGGYSDVVCVPEGRVLPLPDKLSFAEGAAIPVVYLTAWHMLVELANVRRGQTVVVQAAAGGVGIAALQICKRAGARVIGTASPGKHARLRELGIDHAIDYADFDTKVMELTNGRGADIALDAVGGESFKRSYRCLAPVGKLVMFGLSAVVGGDKPSLLRTASAVVRMPIFWPVKLLQENKGVFGVNMGHLWHEEALLIGELREVLKGVEEGAFRPIIDSEVPFAEARRAHERLTQRSNFGKVVLVP